MDTYIVYSITKTFISFPKLQKIKLLKNKRILVNENVYSFEKIGTSQVLFSLIPYFIGILISLVTLSVFIFMFYKITIFDLIGIIVAITGGFSFYPSIENNKKGHIFFLIGVSCLFVGLILSLILKYNLFLFFLCFFFGLFLSGTIFWLTGKTYFIKEKKAIFKIL